jgi:hypothetical protein
VLHFAALAVAKVAVISVARQRRLRRAVGCCWQIDERLGPAADTLDALLAAGECNTYDFAFIGEPDQAMHAFQHKLAGA